MADTQTRTRAEKTMRVALTTIAAGPDGIARQGTLVDLPESVAKEWIDRRFARPYDKDRDKKSQVGFKSAAEAKRK